MKQERMQVNWLDPDRTFDLKESVKILQSLSGSQEYSMVNAQLRPLEGTLIVDFEYESKESCQLAAFAGAIFTKFGYTQNGQIFFSFDKTPVGERSPMDDFNELALMDPEDWGDE